MPESRLMSPFQTSDSSLHSVPAQHRLVLSAINWIRYGVKSNRKSPRVEGGRVTFGPQVSVQGTRAIVGVGGGGIGLSKSIPLSAFPL